MFDEIKILFIRDSSKLFTTLGPIKCEKKPIWICKHSFAYTFNLLPIWAFFFSGPIIWKNDSSPNICSEQYLLWDYEAHKSEPNLFDSFNTPKELLEVDAMLSNFESTVWMLFQIFGTLEIPRKVFIYIVSRSISSFVTSVWIELTFLFYHLPIVLEKRCWAFVYWKLLITPFNFNFEVSWNPNYGSFSLNFQRQLEISCSEGWKSNKSRIFAIELAAKLIMDHSRTHHSLQS